MSEKNKFTPMQLRYIQLLREAVLNCRDEGIGLCCSAEDATTVLVYPESEEGKEDFDANDYAFIKL